MKDVRSSTRSAIQRVVGFLLLFLVGDYAQAQVSGCALQFDGIDDQLRVAGDQFPDAVYTITAWIQTNDGGVIMSRGEHNTTDIQPWNFAVVEQKLSVRIETAATQGATVKGTTTVADGSLHFVALTRDAQGSLFFYVDGAVDASFSTPDPGGTSDQVVLQIGFEFGSPGAGLPQLPADFYTGILDELTLWNVALDADAIESIRLQGLPVDSTGLLGRWGLNEGEGQQVGDDADPPLDGILGVTSSSEGEDPMWVCLPDEVPTLSKHGLATLAAMFIVTVVVVGAMRRSKA